ncbi:MAG: hypothetical protein KBT39_13770 [Bacteroidales bacterium]|nr:hypothetical protein [Bacteroidales bacterium]
MKNTQNGKTMIYIAIIAFILGVATLVLAVTSDNADPEQKKYMFKIGGLVLALSLILFFLSWQTKRRKKNKKNRYHAVHWENGKITKED